MQHAATFDHRDSMRIPFAVALTLHLAVIGTLVVSAWLRSHADSFGAKDAGGGAVPIEAVNSIPIPHHGEQNPLANESQSEVPQTPAKPVERVKEEKPPPDAIPLKTKMEKQKPAKVASQPQVFRPFKELEKNQVTSKSAPQISSPLYTAQPGAGMSIPGAKTTLGARCAGYAAQIQQIVAQHWHTTDVDARLQTAPAVIATYDLMRDGSIRNLQLLQGSGISALDNSVQRAILDSAPFPPIPAVCDKDHAGVEFTFELKR